MRTQNDILKINEPGTSNTLVFKFHKEKQNDSANIQSGENVMVINDAPESRALLLDEFNKGKDPMRFHTIFEEGSSSIQFDVLALSHHPTRSKTDIDLCKNKYLKLQDIPFETNILPFMPLCRYCLAK